MKSTPRLPVILLAVSTLVGCAGEAPAPLPDAAAAAQPAPRRPLPTYASAAERYNQRILPLDRLMARATIRLTYTDANGEQRIEQPDGTLQIVRPRRLAIDLGKSGQKLFWFGSDDDRYWWLDLSDPDDRVAYVGQHARFLQAGGGPAAQRLGLAIPPLDFIAATGIVLLDPQARGGQTQWSRDGRRLGIIAPLQPGDASGGLQRIWVDPETMVPFSVELFDARRRFILIAEHEGDERVRITRTGVPGSRGERPRIPARITVRHFETRTEIRVSLSDAKDGPISDKAFMLDELTRRLGVPRRIDLDQPQP